MNRPSKNEPSRLNDPTTPLGLLASRRSCLVKNMGEPGLSSDELKEVLAAGARVPDHGNLAPWRFVVIEGAARRQLPRKLVETAQQHAIGLSTKQAQLLERFGEDAPTLVAVLYRPVEDTDIPPWEQQLSVGAACQNMLIAATALGYVGQWLTSKPAYANDFAQVLGGNVGDVLAGFLFFGTLAGPIRERARPELSEVSWLLTNFDSGREQA